jgi:hypothetical protein
MIQWDKKEKQKSKREARWWCDANLRRRPGGGV